MRLKSLSRKWKNNLSVRRQKAVKCHKTQLLSRRLTTLTYILLPLWSNDMTSLVLKNNTRACSLDTSTCPLLPPECDLAICWRRLSFLCGSLTWTPSSSVFTFHWRVNHDNRRRGGEADSRKSIDHMILVTHHIQAILHWLPSDVRNFD